MWNEYLLQLLLNMLGICLIFMGFVLYVGALYSLLGLCKVFCPPPPLPGPLGGRPRAYWYYICIAYWRWSSKPVVQHADLPCWNGNPAACSKGERADLLEVQGQHCECIQDTTRNVMEGSELITSRVSYINKYIPNIYIWSVTCL